MAPEPLPPGSRIGILGGGQLGRMLAMAAARLGMRTHVFEPAPDACAGAGREPADTGRLRRRRGARGLRGERRRRHLRVRERARWRRSTRWRALAPVRPGRRALEVAQDRVAEKDFLSAARAARPRPARRSTGRTRWRRRSARLGTPGDPEDPPLRLRRQGTGAARRRRLGAARPGSRSARRRRCSRASWPSSARSR